jgi:uncharacterized protein YoxC
MDDQENEQLSNIHEEVKGSHAQLGAINERTRNIERKIDILADDIEKNEIDINDLEDDVKRNTTIVTGFTGLVSMIALWISDKILKVI